MMDEDELARYMQREQARAYAAIVRNLDWLVTTARPWWWRWWLRMSRSLYGEQLARLLVRLPLEERSEALGQAPEME